MSALSRTLRLDNSRSEDHLTFILDESFWGLKRGDRVYDAFKCLNKFRKNVLSFTVCASRGFQKPKNNYMSSLIPTVHREEWFLAVSDSLAHVTNRPSYWLKRMLSLGTTRDDLLMNLDGTAGNLLLRRLDNLYTGNAPLEYPVKRLETEILDSFVKSFDKARRLTCTRRDLSKYRRRSKDTKIRFLATDLIDFVFESAFELQLPLSAGGKVIKTGDAEWGAAPHELILRGLLKKHGDKVMRGKFLRKLAKALLMILGEVKCTQDLLKEKKAKNQRDRGSAVVDDWTHRLKLNLDCFFEILLPVISLVVISSIANHGKLFTSKDQLDMLLQKARSRIEVVELSTEQMEVLQRAEQLREEEDEIRSDQRARRYFERILGKEQAEELMSDRGTRKVKEAGSRGAHALTALQSCLSGTVLGTTMETKGDDGLLRMLGLKLTEEANSEASEPVEENKEQSLSTTSLSLFEYFTGAEETPEGSFASALDSFGAWNDVEERSRTGKSESGSVDDEVLVGSHQEGLGQCDFGHEAEGGAVGAFGDAFESPERSAKTFSDVDMPWSSTRLEGLQELPNPVDWTVSMIQNTSKLMRNPTEGRKVEESPLVADGHDLEVDAFVGHESVGSAHPPRRDLRAVIDNEASRAKADGGHEEEEVMRRLESSINILFESLRQDMLESIRRDDELKLVAVNETNDDKQSGDDTEMKNEVMRVEKVDKVLVELKSFICTSSHPQLNLLWKQMALQTITNLLHEKEPMSPKVKPMKKRVDWVMMTSKYVFLLYAKGKDLTTMSKEEFVQFKQDLSWQYSSISSSIGTKGYFGEMSRILGGKGKPNKRNLKKLMEVLVGDKADCVIDQLQNVLKLDQKK